MSAAVFPKSARYESRAKRTDAWALTREGILEVDSANAAYPAYVERAAGPYIWDVDGNRYIDYILGYGPVVLGHAHPVVNGCAIDELARGVCRSPFWSRRQFELTELLAEVIPGCELAYLMRTGSDATSAAVRLARIWTGRTHVVKWGYNGWHDWTAPRPDGVPQATQEQTDTFAYNDIESLDRALSRHEGDVACVIMMTYEFDPPKPGFFQTAKRLTHEHGALFILDEMRSGFRIALGGAQEYYGVEADLSTFSKAMSNGFPISAVVGRGDVLDNLRRTHMSSTFFANAPEMAAAIATISILRDTNGPARLWDLGTKFTEGIRAVIDGSSLPAEVVGLPISPFVRFSSHDGPGVETLKRAFYREMLRRGIMLHPNHQWYLSTAHTDEDVNETIQAFKDAVAATGCA